MRRRLLLFAATVVCILTADVRLQACECMGPLPPCQATWFSPIVFVGQVTANEFVERPAAVQLDTFGMQRRVTFRVTEALRGDPGETTVVHTGMGGGDCGYAFTVNRSYLVYAHQTPEGVLTTGICSRTRPESSAGDDLKYLRGQARQPSELVTVAGRAAGPDPKLAHPSIDRSPPYVGGRVVIEPIEAGSSVRYDAVTGEDGRYSIKAPVGRYRATLHVREGLYAIPWGVPEIVDTRGCGETNFIVRPDSRIRGRVIDADGRPVPALSVDLIEESATASLYYRATMRARTDASGGFEFTRLAPGAYRIGLTVRRDGDAADQTSVWLARELGGEPARIEIAAEERASLGDLRAPASVGFARVSGVVRDTTGTLVRAANVYVLTSPRNSIAAGPLGADATGGFSFTLIAGRRYRLSVEIVEGSGELRRTESDPFTAAPGLKPFYLTMPAR